MKYTLSKTPRGKRFQYTVTDENGDIISERISSRDYVACTANGEFYFGRLDLIGKGEHGQAMRDSAETMNNKCRSKEVRERYSDRLNDLKQIAYLKQKGEDNEMGL